jgi:RNase P subunit RPR2
MYNYTQGYQLPLTMENYYYTYINLCAQGFDNTMYTQGQTSDIDTITKHCGAMDKAKEKKFKCRSCDKMFSSEKQAQTHHKNIHEKTTQVTCSKCERVFSNKYVLKKHNSRHHPPTASIS